MNLGGLEFKAEDFVDIIKLCGFGADSVIEIHSQSMANNANRILTERLMKVPEGNSDWPPHLQDEEIDAYIRLPYTGREWKYRIVCGEEILEGAK